MPPKLTAAKKAEIARAKHQKKRIQQKLKKGKAVMSNEQYAREIEDRAVRTQQNLDSRLSAKPFA